MSGQWVRGRDITRNPLASQCQMAWRRICGTCTHFSGEAMTDVAWCTRHEEAVDGRARAWACDDWTRKVAP